jgi:hypothetical protein
MISFTGSLSFINLCALHRQLVLEGKIFLVAETSLVIALKFQRSSSQR